MANGYNTGVYRRIEDGAVVVSGQSSVTQATSITTGVTLNALSGAITTVSQTVAGGAEASFTLTNNKIAATDVVVACIKTHTSAGLFLVACTAVADGSCQLTLSNLSASAGDNVLVINFLVHKCEA